MRMQAALYALLAAPAMADVVSCDFSGMALEFTLDRTQFAPPVSPDEPPRRQLTIVTADDATFRAEPFIIGTTIGFLEEDGERKLFMASDGDAVYDDPAGDAQLTGRCEVLQ